MENEKPFPNEKKPYILNVNASSYIRINYDLDNWRALIEMLKNPEGTRKILNLNKAQLVNDAMSLARVGKLPYNAAMDVLDAFKHNEDHYVPWEAALGTLNYLGKRLLSDETHLDKFEHFVEHLLEDRYHSLTFDESDNDKHLDKLSRISVLNWMCKVGYSDCVAKSKTYFDDWKNNGNGVSPNMRDVVYNTAVRESNENWKFIHEKFQTVKVDSERLKYIHAMGSTEDETLLETFLNMTIKREESGIRLQDCLYVYRDVSVNKVGRNVIMNWMESYYDEIYGAFVPNGGAAAGKFFLQFFFLKVYCILPILKLQTQVLTVMPSQFLVELPQLPTLQTM